MSISIKSDAEDVPRRKAPRYAVDASIAIVIEGGNIVGRCVNLSASGLCAEVQGAISPGSIVSLALTLEFDQGDFSEPLPLPARNVWCTQIDTNSFQVGFQFTALDPEQAGFLKVFLRYLQD